MPQAKNKLSKFEQEFNFTGPIPGQSLTTDLKARPYTRPPQYVKTKDVLEYYLKAIMTKDGKQHILDAFMSGMPVCDIVENLVGLGAMEGVHSIDSSTLVAPALVEAVAMIGDEYQQDYLFGLPEEDEEEYIRPSFIDAILVDLEDEDEFADVDASEVEAVQDVPEESTVELPTQVPPSKGLMSRKPMNG